MTRLAAALVAALFAFGAGPASAQNQAPRGRLIVTVNDPTGGFLPTATVTIAGLEASTRTATLKPLLTTNTGIAIFDNLVPGRYSAAAEFSGFEKSAPKEVRVRAGDNRTTIVLAIARFQDSVTVGRDRQEAGSDRASTFGSLLTAEQIAELSDDPEVMRQQLEELAGPGVIFAVDSFEGGQLPNKSQIRSIRISRDQFAAESHFAGGTRIDIVTQPGQGDLRGTVSSNFYTSALDGKNPLVQAAQPNQNLSAVFSLSGSLIKDRMGFTLNVQTVNSALSPIQSQSVVSGLGPTVLGVTARSRNVSVVLGIDWAVTKDQTVRMSFSRQRGRQRDQGAGGYDSLERLYDGESHSSSFSFGHTGPIGRRMMWYNRGYITTPGQSATSATEALTLIIPDDVNRGGAQRRGGTFAINFGVFSDLDYVRGRHSFRMGVEVAGTRSRSDSESNYLGTYYFESPEAFAAGRPRSFTKRIGDPNVVFVNGQISMYVQDDIRLSKTLTMTPGVRYEVQTHVKDYNGVLPRFGVTWAPAGGQTTYRASLGLFHDWLEAAPYQQTLLFDGFRQREINIANPSYPDPGTVGAATPAQRYLLADDLVMPRTARASLGIQRTFNARMSVTGTYAYTKSDRQFLGENANAPVNGVRPDPDFSNVIRVTSGGKAQAHTGNASLSVNLAGLGSNPTLGPWFQWRRGLRIGGSYNYGRSFTNTDGAFSVPATDLASEWGPSLSDIRHRASVNLGTTAVRGLSASASFSWASGRPVTIRTGTDDNGDLIFNDRPLGVGRGSVRVPGQWNSSASFGYTFSMGSRQVSNGNGVSITSVNGVITANTNAAPVARYRLSVTTNIQNLFNRAQWGNYNTIVTSENFLQPTSASGVRRISVNVGLSF